jgi:hypothetical protein
VSSRRVLLTGLAALLVLSVAVSAHAAPARGGGRPSIHSITLTPEGSGTLIRLTYVGREHPHTRVLRSREPIDALAVADVDNDGDLDILAAGRQGELRLWRNAGGGRFVLAAAAISRHVDYARRNIRVGNGVFDDQPEQAGDERYDAAMPRAPALASDPGLISAPPTRARSFGAVVPSFSPGRAPPTHA